MNILFRCDGSVEVGMGHVVRCLALADHLKEIKDCSIHFAIRHSELGIKKVKETYPVIRSKDGSFNYIKWLSDCIIRTNSDTLIMDMRDGLTREELKSIKRKTGIKIVTIDDPEDKRLEADLAFCPPVPQLEKLNWDGFGGELYVGWEYVLLRKEFLKQYPKPKNSVPNILVSMGGTDEKNLTEFVINSLNKINEQFKATVIVGTGYPYLNQLKNSLKQIGFEFELHTNPKNIAEIMSQADFSVISFGQTAYELAALQVPAIYLCLTSDHFESSKLFVKEGIGISLGVYSKAKEKDLLEILNNKLKEKSISSRKMNISNPKNISSLIIG